MLSLLTAVRLADSGALGAIEPDGTRGKLRNLLSQPIATLPVLSDVIGRRYFNLVDKDAKWVRAHSHTDT